MNEPSELYAIQEPVDCVEGSVEPRPVAAPWPPQVEWEDFLRRWKSQKPQ